jgi:hypothetical protein
MQPAPTDRVQLSDAHVAAAGWEVSQLHSALLLPLVQLPTTSTKMPAFSARLQLLTSPL